MFLRFRAPACGAIAALWLAACAGDGPAPAGSASGFDQVQREIFNQSCTTAGCHNPQSVAGGLILTQGFSFDALVGVTPQNAAAANAGLARVEPFAVDQSFIIRKLTDPGPGQGSRMPLGADPLPAEQIDLIRAWIRDGAPPPETPSPAPQPTATPTPTRIPGTPTAPAPTATPTDVPVATGTPTTAGDTPTPSATSTPGEPTVSLAQVQEQIFTPNCAIQFCHSGDFPASQLSLEDGNAFDELVGVTPLNPAAASDGLLRVDPGDPENSFLFVKVTGPPLAQGQRMPLGGNPLPDEQIELIRRWILGLE